MKLTFLLICFQTLFLYLNGQNQLLIDDFKSGPFSRTTTSISSNTNIQGGRNIIKCGNSIQGYRQTTMDITSNPYIQPLNVSIFPSNGVFALSSGYKVGQRVTLGYGVTKDNKSCPLNLDLSRNKSFKLDFEGWNKQINFSIHVKCNNYSIYANYSENLDPEENGKVITVPFSSFVNATTPFDWKDVETITFIFQSTGATLGNDLAIKKIWIE
jgi:hypothetical protein